MVLEARDKLARAKDHRNVLGGAALERLTLDRTLKRQDDPVALFRAFALGDERPILFGDPLQSLIDLGVGDLGGEPGELDGLEIGSVIGGRISISTV